MPFIFYIFPLHPNICCLVATTSQIRLYIRESLNSALSNLMFGFFHLRTYSYHLQNKSILSIQIVHFKLIHVGDFLPHFIAGKNTADYFRKFSFFLFFTLRHSSSNSLLITCHFTKTSETSGYLWKGKMNDFLLNQET